ncbi:c6 zinc finger domain containing protein [Niveomyces insectorum RCEF 264]|uniref:C6 zinc finger domain containing protein n=1 Tax=Niveomyces insectorum RCEF 264 TaxID=1081102 RepID=A0A167UUM0_9HYPO|nr:c6 zinc finger domain containing protein [Niveomyces insectorum RCEF 264]
MPLSAGRVTGASRARSTVAAPAASTTTTTTTMMSTQNSRTFQAYQQRRHLEKPVHADGTDEANGASGDDRSDGGDGADDDDDDDDRDRDTGIRSSKRKRPETVSCELCKQRKVKCDRAQPACGWCSRNGAMCVYKERKKPGLRAGYGRELEARLDRLEARLGRQDELEATVTQLKEVLQAFGPTTIASAAAAASSSSVRSSNTSHAGDHQTPQDHTALPPPTFPRVESARTPQAEAALFLQKPSSASAGPFTVGHVASLPGTGTGSGSNNNVINNNNSSSSTSPGFLNHTNHNNHNAYTPAPATGFSPVHHTQLSPLTTPTAHDYYGQTATGTPLPSLLPPPPPPPPAAASTHSASSIWAGPGATLAPEDDLPPYDLAYNLVDLYFKHINTWCPLLQRTPTIEALFGPSRGTTENNNNNRDDADDEANRILLHAIVATTLRFATDARLTPAARRRYYDAAKQRVVLYGMEHASVTALQALVVLALDFCGRSNGPPGWNIMALITRAVVQLGLAAEATSWTVAPRYASIATLRAVVLREPRDFVEDEARRRLFWVVYLLDRYATLATAFGFALDDGEIDRALPCRDDLWARNQKVVTRRFRGSGPRPDGGGDGGGSGGGSADGDEYGRSDSHESDFTAAAGAAADVAAAADDSGGGTTSIDAHLGAFSYYIEVLGILTQIHNFLRQPVDIASLRDVERWQRRYRALDQALARWWRALPDAYANVACLGGAAGVVGPAAAATTTAPPTCAWIMLHVTYHTATIRLHSSAAYPTTRSAVFAPSYAASQRCLAAVEHIGALSDAAVVHGLLPHLGPPFAFSLWVAARVCLVHGAVGGGGGGGGGGASSSNTMQTTSRLHACVDALRALGHYWPVADRYCALLQRVLDELDELDSAGGSSSGNSHNNNNNHNNPNTDDGQPPAPRSVRILADMRRTAFDLDLLISRQPRGAAGTGNGGHPLDNDPPESNSNGNGNGNNGGGNGNGNGNGQQTWTPAYARPSQTPARTPARTPQSQELAYLDVFDFFNVPRLPFGLPGDAANAVFMNGGGGDGSSGGGGNGLGDGLTGTGNVDLAGIAFANEYNMTTDFMMDANRDWLFPQDETPKYLA